MKSQGLEPVVTETKIFSFLQSDETQVHSRFKRHTKALIWKSYLQRQRRWRVLLVECLFGLVLFIISVFVAKPVFLTPIQDMPKEPITGEKLLSSVKNTILGYAPNVAPYTQVIDRASVKLNIPFIDEATEEALDNKLYDSAKGATINKTVVWIIFKPKYNNMWRFSIKSTDRVMTDADDEVSDTSHSLVFLGVQTAVSQAILDTISPNITDNYAIGLTSMPVSPLMDSNSVRVALSIILLCYTTALLPPVIEAQALVVHETQSTFKHAMLVRHVNYSSVYIGWMVYAYLTVFPLCVIGAIVMILIFRWIHLLYALMTLLSYVSVMIMLALIMAMFHSTALVSCLWSILVTFLQTLLSELLVHHGFIQWHKTVSFLLHIFIPPLGLIHAFNEFALLQMGGRFDDRWSIFYTILMWTVMNLMYFALLMLLQRTIGQERAIGGQVSWRSIIFKKAEDTRNVLRPVPKPTGKERENIQEVDELMAKAISFSNVSKSIMNVKVLKNITFDIYRGEYTMLFAERNQARMVNTCENLLTGLTFPDHGTINILGKTLTPDSDLMSTPNMMGYCHQSMFLVEDMTVKEHLELFMKICLWNETESFRTQYSHIRLKRLLSDCHLEEVKHEYIGHLDIFFRAQLCWAIAMLLEPRIVILPDFAEPLRFISVIRDKIVQYKKYITIIKMSFATINMVYADRIFVLDSKTIAFGGTPAYMFFKYGREYRVRVTLRGGGSFDNDRVAELLQKALDHGATVRANFGSLLILRLPTTPTASVTALVKDMQERSIYYGISSVSISLPDSEEICKRAMTTSRDSPTDNTTNRLTVLRQFAENVPWRLERATFPSLNIIKSVGWKYFSFCIYYRFYFFVTLILAIAAGVLIGLSLSGMLVNLESDHIAITKLHGEVLTVEKANQKTTLIVGADNSNVSESIATYYVLSETNVSKSQTDGMFYTALMNNDSLIEYLVTRAIDSPQQYVYMYAYGLNVSESNGKVQLQALYSPIHRDKSAAARSLARLYMALIRHITNTSDASIQVTDDPLSLDFTPFLKYAGEPPLVIMFLLVVTISHMTLIPSKEYGLVKHLQCHAYNFSPLRYWMSLYFCDLILYWLLVGFIAIAIICVMYINIPADHFQYTDLLVVPFILVIYGVASVPQSYLFTRGPRAALNAMSFVIINVIFGEATVVAKMFFNLEKILIIFMRMWPQFNTGFAFVKIKQIFLYNSECILFKTENLCYTKTLHKCCKKCGLLQHCYKERHYLTTPGILGEVTAMLVMTGVFISVLLLWEYQIIQVGWTQLMILLKGVEVDHGETLSPGLLREKAEVHDKVEEIKTGHPTGGKVNTFGESLLCANLTKKRLGEYVLRNIYLGLGKGEVLAISGLRKHGRVALIESLAGLSIPYSGKLWADSKWKLNTHPSQYCRRISISCEHNPLPMWMTVYDALHLIATLRGMPQKFIEREVTQYIYALELTDVAETLICRIPLFERTRIHFAAAVIAAPQVIIIDECTNYQNYSVCRAMYFILYQMKTRGHSLFVSSHNIESHMPMTNRLGILVDGRIVDIDLVDNLIARYTQKGYTVVVHLKDEVDVERMFAEHFSDFVINDTSDVLVNIQVLDADLNWSTVFERMEELQRKNSQVYTYIVTCIPIDYIYNSIIINEIGNKQTSGDIFAFQLLSKLFGPTKKIQPTKAMLDDLKIHESKYDITKLKELPWSVIFQR